MAVNNQLSPLPVLNGLKLKQRNKELPFKAFNYTPIIRYPPDLPPTDWHLLSVDGVDRDHIRIHLLKDGDDLLSCIKAYKSNHAKAVIVVNSNEDTTLPPDISQPFIHMTDFLVAVLPFSEGKILINILQTQFKNNELFTILDVISTETTPGFPTVAHHIVFGTGFSYSRLLFGAAYGNRSIFDLNSEIKKIMLNGNDHIKRITDDPNRFTMIMAAFTQYERIGIADHPIHINELIGRFQRYLEASFEYEFPFFLILVCRLNKFRQFYECEELGLFTKRCIKLFEAISFHHVSQILLEFLEKKDFDIMFGLEETVSVFILLATAAIDLMSLVKTRLANERIIYCRILWISVYLKFLSETNDLTRSMVTVWDNHFIQKISKRKPITIGMINDFKCGLKLSTLLQLPINCQFTIHHLSRFIADEKLIRPLANARDIVTGLEEFIHSDKDLLVHILIKLNTSYSPYLQSSDPKCIGMTSVDGTLQSTIDEGILFLDSITKLWNAKGWNTGDLHKDFRDEFFKWILLLLGTIKMTDPNVHILLKKFLALKRSSIVADRNYRSQIVHHILHKTRKAFPDLSIQQFYLLYRSYRIWPIPFLFDYLEQYCIPVNVNIADPIWSEFFTEIVSRHMIDEIQNVILDFTIKMAKKYRQSQHSRNFIPDIFQLNVCYLFSSTGDPDEKNAISIEDRFMDFIQDYIRQNNLHSTIIQDVSLISKDGVEKLSTMHFLILKVLQQEFQNGITDDISWQSVGVSIVKDYSRSIISCQSFHSSWLQYTFSPLEMFHWCIIYTVCSKIPFNMESFEWLVVQPWSILSSVFKAYCTSRNLSNQDCLLTESAMPIEVAECQNKYVHEYFLWIQRMQEYLFSWQNRFLKNSVNFDEILRYDSYNASIHFLGNAVSASKYVMDLEDIRSVKELFLIGFEQLNWHLIKYIPDHPESKYCNLVELLLCYGVQFPANLQQMLENKVILPGQDIPAEQKLKNDIDVSSQGLFEPEQEVALIVTKSFTLHDLQRLLENLEEFLEPIQEYMKMLVFFHLQKSKIFSKLLSAAVAMVEAAYPLKSDSLSIGSTTSSLNNLSMMSLHRLQKHDNYIITGREVSTIVLLQNALNFVEKVILKMLKGTATYSDIVGGGILNLHTLDTDREEIQKLRQFSKQLKMNDADCEIGLEGLRSITELVWFHDHIYQHIRETCQQCGLVECLKDEVLQKIEMELEINQSALINLTLLEASEKMASIKRALCIEDDNSCLLVFPLIAKSASLCRFVTNMRQSTAGHDQVTAQIHGVTDQLSTFFEIIALFKDKSIPFLNLIKKLKNFTANIGLKKLKTVEKNIPMIEMMLKLMSGQSHRDMDTNGQARSADFNDFFKTTGELWKMYEERNDQQERELMVLEEQQQGMSDEIQALTEELKQERKRNIKIQQEYQEEKEKHTRAMAEFQKLQKEFELEKEAHEKEMEDLRNGHQQEKNLLEKDKAHMMLQTKCRYLAEELKTEKKRFSEVQHEYQEEKDKHTKTMNHFWKLQGEYEVIKAACAGEIKELQKNYQQEKALLDEKYAQLELQIRYLADELEKERQHVTEVQQKYQEEKEKHTETMTGFRNLQGEYEIVKTAHEKEIQEMEEKNTRAVLALQEIIKQFEQSWRISHKDIALTNQKLGKGAWGNVKVGVYQGEKVAVKQLHNLIVSEDTLAIMNREINTMSRLRHPHLLLFIGAVLDHPSGNPLIITEIMDTSLRHAYEKGQLITNDETSKLSVLRDTASGLNYLHCHHDEIIHRDVSSANVLLESRGTNKWRAKVSDFGSANIARESTTPAAGAQVYSAPETLTAITDETSYPQTTKMDVYSYGILTCEVMCCRFPDREQFQSMLRSIGKTSPILVQLINDCTVKNPLERPSMAQVIQQLARIMAQDKTWFTL